MGTGRISTLEGSARATPRPQVTALAAAVAFGLLLATVACNTTRWIGETFPGFFLIENRVVASIELPDWGQAAAPSRVFQHQVLAVDGVEVDTAAAAYAAVRRRPPGTAVTYRLRAPDGSTTTATLPTRRFGSLDWALLFGAYLATALVFGSVGLVVFVLKPADPSARGLCVAGLTVALWGITAADLYGPHWFVRVHLLAEAMVIASLIHLALVFPTVRLQRRRGAVLAAVYAAVALLAAVYEVALHSPSAYTAVHRAATVGHVLALTAMLAAVGWDWATTRSMLIGRRIRVVALGTLAAFVGPLVIFGASAALGGDVPVNAAAFTGFIFPVTLGYAIVSHDLFEIDVMLRRATTYFVVVLAVTTIYLAALLLLPHVAPIGDVVRSPELIAVLNLALVFAMAPLCTRVQSAVDRLFFRAGYDAERALSTLSHDLVAAHTIADVTTRTRRLLDDTLAPSWCDVLLGDAEGGFHPATGASAGAPLALPEELLARLARGDVLARYEWDDGTDRALPDAWRAVPGDLVVPFGRDPRPTGVLVLGPKRSGRAYGFHDIALLQAAASQVALGLANAQAFDELAALNASLEDQVRERTAALETANDGLARSLEELQGAYSRLERNQTSLVRADRLATLGRLTAGIAHEVNTPLGAVLNALAIVAGLGDEYARSIEHPVVTPDDHRSIARDIVDTTTQAISYARRAAAFINKVKMHGRDHRGAVEPFVVRRIVAETEALLAHRLEAAGCELVFDEDPAGITVVGEPARFAQVVVNLTTNAIDAYEDRSGAGGRIEVRARGEGERIVLTVRDWAGGMPPEIVDHIFEELFTTKEPGRGTGLGLWIGRNLIEESFGGTLVAETTPGEGSCFTITIPIPPAARTESLAGAAA